MLKALTAALLLAATSLAAQPAVTSITPNNGPTSGGTEVTITGTGFSSCIICSPPFPPAVYFGDLPARSVVLVSETTMRAVAPSHLAGEVFVNVDQWNGRTTSNARFTYTGDSADAVERVLLPVFMPPVPGAFGSDFRTDLRIWNRSAQVARLWGLRASTSAYLDVNPFSELNDQNTDRSAGPGRFVDVLRDVLPNLVMNLRAYDVSRSATNFGTEIPIVRDADFKDVIALTGVPLDPRFRLKLRIYGLGSGYWVAVTAGGETQEVRLRTPRDGNDPAYTEITFFPPEPQPNASPTTTILVRALEPITSPPMFPKPRVWAFVTVTNNETQHITTITPQ